MSEDKVYYRVLAIALKIKSYIAGHPNIYVMLADIESALAGRVSKPSLSQDDIYNISIDVLGIDHLELSEDKIDKVHADVMRNNLKVLARVLWEKIAKPSEAKGEK